MNKYEQLCQYIDEEKDNLIKDLMTISAIESVSNADSDVKPFGQGCRDVLDTMLAIGERDGFEAKNYEYYAGSIKWDNGKAEDIGLLAHLDVVPAGNDWTVCQPYQPTIKDGYLFGRGTGDNKSAAIASLYIMKAFRKYNVELNHNVKLLLGTDEEVGMRDMKYYTSHYQTPKFTFVPDAGLPGVAGEFGRLRYLLKANNKLSEDFVDLYAGTAFNIIPNKAVAVLSKNTSIKYQDLPAEIEVKDNGETVEVTAFGLTCHAAFPEGGKNAIKVLTSALLSVEGMKDNDRKIIEFIDNVNNDCYGTFLNIANTDEISGQTVSSGTVLRYNDGRVSLLNDCRCCVTDNPDNLEVKAREVSEKYDFTLVADEKSYGAYIDPNGAIVNKIKDVYQEHTGIRKEIGIMKGGTYAGKLKNAFATGCSLRSENSRPEYLPAGHGSAHAPDEYVCIKDYIAGIKLLMKMILEVDKVL